MTTEQHPSLAHALAAFQGEKDCRRFFKYVIEEPTQGCWIWIGSRARHGYGSFYYRGHHTVAHRWALEHLGGMELIPGLVVDHLCRVKSCVNPGHLEQVSQRVNVMRGIGNLNRYKTHCIRNHEFTRENTQIPPKGGRVCLTCRREYDRARYEARKAVTL